MKFLIVALGCLCISLSGLEIDTSFAPDMKGRQLIRTRFNAAENRVEFRKDGASYYQAARTVPAEIPPGSAVTVTAGIDFDDPAGTDAKHTQLRLVFLDAAGKTVFSQGENGKGIPLRHTAGKSENFSCSYRAPANVHSLKVLIKSHVPVTMDVHNIRISVKEPAEAAGVPFTIRSIEPDSIANHSFLNHKPAGKFGWAEVRVK